MNKNILNTGVQNFIDKKIDTDIASVLLKGTNFEGVSTKEIVEQIEARKKCKNKLPNWYNTSRVYYPNKLSVEQTSSEISAQYKASIINGKSLIDLTGGLGVDCYYFSKKFNRVTHCEINKNLSEIAAYNSQVFDVQNIDFVPENGVDFLKKSDSDYDWIYVDPSRRNDIKGKVFMLNDCLPNIPENLSDLFRYSNNIMIKTSPILDLSIGIKELTFVKEIHIVAIKNEVKELLWILKKNDTNSISIKTINIKKEDKETFDFNYSDESDAIATYSSPLLYLYEPNAAILKSGAFNLLSDKLNLKKLHQHSHLYTSTELIDFPGRCFKITDTFKYHKKTVKKNIGNTNGNITTRNFPESVDQLRKSLKIKDGGNNYYFFTTDNNGDRIVVSCLKP
ncbi:class I SAM-dependent methyltransferase [Flavobacteriaceae bacterium R38]|nr:class I SAM-dependent methyltransferase [Flavobacteriaceae bacterium R38]